MSEIVDRSGGQLSVPASLRDASESTIVLRETIRRFNDRAPELKRLRDELGSLASTLDSLLEFIEVETSLFTSMGGFFRRCSQVCRKIEESMKLFYQMPITRHRDWRKMVFMGGGIDDLIDTVSEYHSVALVILCIPKM